MRGSIGLPGFERKFTTDDDPWGCRSSAYEALKRRRALSGLPLAATALDVACGDGAGTQALAARALTVDAVDGSEAALSSARRLLAEGPRLRFRRARLPRELPQGRWRRILVSELVYYLAPHEISSLAAALVLRLEPRGELIAVHHVTPFADARTRPLRAARLFHGCLAGRLGLCFERYFSTYVVTRWRRF